MCMYIYTYNFSPIWAGLYFSSALVVPSDWAQLLFGGALKPSHVRKEVGTLLSRPYHQIVDTITSMKNFNPFEGYPFTTMKGWGFYSVSLLFLGLRFSGQRSRTLFQESAEASLPVWVLQHRVLQLLAVPPLPPLSTFSPAPLSALISPASPDPSS